MSLIQKYKPSQISSIVSFFEIIFHVLGLSNLVNFIIFSAGFFESDEPVPEKQKYSKYGLSTSLLSLKGEASLLFPQSSVILFEILNSQYFFIRLSNLDISKFNFLAILKKPFRVVWFIIDGGAAFINFIE